MKIEKVDVLLLQSAYYFIEHHHYSFIKTQVVGKEIWLGNPSAEYPVIHLTSLSYESSYFDKDRVTRIHQAISSLLQRNEKLLNIHLTSETIEDTEEEFYEASLYESHTSGVNLLAKFPDLMSAFKSSGNLSKDYLEIARKIDQVSVKEVKKKQSPSAGRFSFLNQIPTATKVVLALCILIFVISIFLSQKFGEITAAIMLGAYYKEFIFINHDFWRFLTSGFIHISFWHLLMNMLALVNIGRLMEKVFGPKKYILILLGSIIFGNAFCYILGENIVAVGLSGGLYGLLAAMLIYFINTGLIRKPQIMSNVINTVFINLMINLMPNISVLGHLGGFVGGLFLALLLYPDNLLSKMKKHAVAAFVIFCCLITFKCSQVKNLDQLYIGTDLNVVSALKTWPVDFYTEPLYENLVEYYIKCGVIY